MKRIALVLIFFGIHSAFASELVSNEELQLQQAAKNRLYPGGHDEEPLQVQSQLTVLSRKMQPAQEPVEVPDESPNANSENQ